MFLLGFNQFVFLLHFLLEEYILVRQNTPTTAQRSHKSFYDFSCQTAMFYESLWVGSLVLYHMFSVASVLTSHKLQKL
jgi:hypothetical protein